MAASYLSRGMTQSGHIQPLRSRPATEPRVPRRRWTRELPPSARGLRVRRRRSRLALGPGLRSPGSRRVRRVALHRRRVGDSGRARGAAERAAARSDSATSGGATRRVDPPQPDHVPDGVDDEGGPLPRRQRGGGPRWSTSRCDERMAWRRRWPQRGQQQSPDLPARATSKRLGGSGCRRSAPWPTRTSRPSRPNASLRRDGHRLSRSHGVPGRHLRHRRRRPDCHRGCSCLGRDRLAVRIDSGDLLELLDSGPRRSSTTLAGPTRRSSSAAGSTSSMSSACWTAARRSTPSGSAPGSECLPMRRPWRPSTSWSSTPVSRR